jgi:hypothetical protein
VIACPNCGAQNQPGSRFCENCGADLRSLAVPTPQPPTPEPSPPPTPPPAFVPPPSESRVPWELPPTAPEWRMSSLPPEQPPPARRRTWVWVLIACIALIVLCCCGSIVWANTDSGQHWLERKGTQLSDYMTEEAGK